METLAMKMVVGIATRFEVISAIEFDEWLDDNMQQRDCYPMSAMKQKELLQEFLKTKQSDKAE